MRWSKIILIVKNKPLPVFVSGDYQLCADLRAFDAKKQPLDRFNFGVYFKKRYVTERETLDEAKQAAELHAELGDDL